MTARTHDLAAISGLVGTIFIMGESPRVTLATAVACLVANQLGGIAPDIDQPTAPLWRNLPIGGLFGKIASRMLGGHRFLTHSLIGVGLLGWLVWLLLTFLSPLFQGINMGYVWWAFIIGVLSHLVMDSFTKEGVPWLLPIPIKFGFPPLKRLRVTTGKKMENFVIFPVIIILNMLFVATNYQWLQDIIHNRIV